MLNFHIFIKPQKKLLKFASIGIFATFVHGFVFLYLIQKHDLHEQLANISAFSIALVVSYFGQRFWTFSANNVSNEHKAKIKFVASSLLSLLLNTFWIYITVQILSYPPDYAIVGIVLFTPLSLFIALNYWVFV